MKPYSRAEQIRAEQLGRNGEEKGRSAPLWPHRDGLEENESDKKIVIAC